MNPVSPMSVASISQPVPPRGTGPSSYLVGQDGEGHWVAMETGGKAGGLFRSRQDAIRYACIETGCRPDDVTLAVEPIRFRLS